MKRILFACVACMGLLMACTPEENPSSPSTGTSISVDKKEVTLDSEGGSFRITVTCSVPTTVEVTYEGTEKDWFTQVLPRALKGNGTIDVTVAKYLEYDVTRVATMTIKGKGVSETVKVTQNGRQKPAATALDLNKYNVYADVAGGSFPIEVATAGDWTATSNADWCTVQNASGSGVGTFNVVVARSEDYQYRTATVTVAAGAITREVLVQHVGTKIGDLVWANANVGEPDTFCDNCDDLGMLYQWRSKRYYPSTTVIYLDEAGNHKQESDATSKAPNYDCGPNGNGQDDAGGLDWPDELNPCPSGWRVPTKDELNTLVDGGKKYTVNYWMVWGGMSTAGAFCGLDKQDMMADCSKGNMNGAIFIPIAGAIHSGYGWSDADNGMVYKEDLEGRNLQWWNATVWTATTARGTDAWDIMGMWMCSADDVDSFGFAEYPSRYALSVRCVLAE